MSEPTPERQPESREWKSIDRWIVANSMSAAPESTASDHYYIDGFNKGLREAAELWRHERERWAQEKDRNGEILSALEVVVHALKNPGCWCSDPKCGCDTIRAVRYGERLLAEASQK